MAASLPHDVVQTDPERAVLLAERFKAISVYSGYSLPEIGRV